MWEIDGRQCSNRPKARFGLVIGHAGWGFGREYPAKMFNMLLVREPVARALSHANFLHSRRSEYGHRFGDLLVRYNEVRTNAPWMLSAPNVSFVLRLPHLCALYICRARANPAPPRPAAAQSGHRSTLIPGVVSVCEHEQ